MAGGVPESVPHAVPSHNSEKQSPQEGDGGVRPPVLFVGAVRHVVNYMGCLSPLDRRPIDYEWERELEVPN